MEEEQFTKMNDSLDTLSAMMIGYKNKLMAGGEGFSEESAEFMAVQLHEVMCSRMVEVE